MAEWGAAACSQVSCTNIRCLYARGRLNLCWETGTGCSIPAHLILRLQRCCEKPFIPLPARWPGGRQGAILGRDEQLGEEGREERAKEKKGEVRKCLMCEPGRLRCSEGIPRAGSGPAEPGDRRCGSWLLSSSRTSRSSWSAEFLSATTHYFQWAVSCGGEGRAWGQRAAGTEHLCLGIAASPGLPRGGGHGQMGEAEQRGEKKERERQREGRRQRCPGTRTAVPSAPVRKKSQPQPELQSLGCREGHTTIRGAELHRIKSPSSSCLQ